MSLADQLIALKTNADMRGWNGSHWHIRLADLVVNHWQAIIDALEEREAPDHTDRMAARMGAEFVVREAPAETSELVKRLRARQDDTCDEAAAALVSLTTDRDYYANRYADRCGQLLVRDGEIASLTSRNAELERQEEQLGEALVALSARLKDSGFLNDDDNHAAYEKVVAAFTNHETPHEA